MSRKSLCVIGLLSLCLGQPLWGQGSLPPANRWIPPDALICLEVSEPREILKLLADKELSEKIQQMPFYQKQAASKGFQEFLGMVRIVEATLGTDWRSALARLTGSGITIAVCPQDTVLLIVDAEDAGMLNQLHDFFLNIARTEAQKQNRSESLEPVQLDGIDTWSFDGKEAHAIISNRLILASRPEGLQAVLDRRNGTVTSCLERLEAYRQARRAAGADRAAMVYINLNVLKQVPALAGALDQSKNNPLAALLFSGITESLRASQWLALKLRIREHTLLLNALADGRTVDPAGPAAFSLPEETGQGALPICPVPRFIGGFSFYRDLHRFYAAKDDLFPERTSALIFFENMMGIFFSGRDLTDEVLGEIQPEIRLVVAEQQYDPAIGTPQVCYPAFAAVLRLREPEQFAEVMEEAWQKALGLINFTRGQQALPGLIIDRPEHHQTKFTVAYFSTTGIEDPSRLPERFNLRPALAMVGEFLILSSTEQLARDLIEALDAERQRPVRPMAQVHSLVEIDGGQLASILKANYQTFVRKNMVDEGKTQEQAEAAIDVLITLVGLIDRLRLEVGSRRGLARADLEVRLNLP
ncbi:MAG: hypothetical protein JW810_08340 [Sedimentisphaerales bacterium]|nr:hypothetical protein [Sedimentisphaerales bacterium]